MTKFGGVWRKDKIVTVAASSDELLLSTMLAIGARIALVECYSTTVEMLAGISRSF